MRGCQYWNNQEMAVSYKKPFDLDQNAFIEAVDRSRSGSGNESYNAVKRIGDNPDVMLANYRH